MSAIENPPHYGGADNPYEAIKVIEANAFGFNLGNTYKYIARADHKGNRVQDLQKAAWYLNREIEQEQELQAFLDARQEVLDIENAENKKKWAEHQAEVIAFLDSKLAAADSNVDPTACDCYECSCKAQADNPVDTWDENDPDYIDHYEGWHQESGQLPKDDAAFNVPVSIAYEKGAPNVTLSLPVGMSVEEITRKLQEVFGGNRS